MFRINFLQCEKIISDSYQSIISNLEKDDKNKNKEYHKNQILKISNSVLNEIFEYALYFKKYYTLHSILDYAHHSLDNTIIKNQFTELVIQNNNLLKTLNKDELEIIKLKSTIQEIPALIINKIFTTASYESEIFYDNKPNNFDILIDIIKVKCPEKIDKNENEVASVEWSDDNLKKNKYYVVHALRPHKYDLIIKELKFAYNSCIPEYLKNNISNCQQYALHQFEEFIDYYNILSVSLISSSKYETFEKTGFILKINDLNCYSALFPTDIMAPSTDFYSKSSYANKMDLWKINLKQFLLNKEIEELKDEYELESHLSASPDEIIEYTDSNEDSCFKYNELLVKTGNNCLEIVGVFKPNLNQMSSAFNVFLMSKIDNFTNEVHKYTNLPVFELGADNWFDV